VKRRTADTAVARGGSLKIMAARLDLVLQKHGRSHDGALWRPGAAPSSEISPSVWSVRRVVACLGPMIVVILRGYTTFCQRSVAKCRGGYLGYRSLTVAARLREAIVGRSLTVVARLSLGKWESAPSRSRLGLV
jgi:hypothetical protein